MAADMPLWITCPNCGDSMYRDRSIPNLGGSEFATYVCRSCSATVTKSDKDTEKD
jgi:transposase-like protein